MKITVQFILATLLSINSSLSIAQQQRSAVAWPQVKKEMQPWTRWWWMGSAVDEENLGYLLTTYKKAGFGGVEVTPIYGAIGYENRYIDFLSPKWMNMLNFTVQKATSLGMGVDLNTGTGWPFGGPQIKSDDAASKLVIQTYRMSAGSRLTESLIMKDEKQRLAGAMLQAVTAYGDKGEVVSLFDQVDKDGRLQWMPSSGNWEVYAAFCGKTLQRVKRAAPGGEGLVVDHLSKKSVNVYLNRFDQAFTPKVAGFRAFFNDSYEVYDASWSPDFFDLFQHNRGYDLRLYLRQLASSDSSSDEVARIKSDYRETMGEMLLENFTRNWTSWAHGYQKLTKNQAHGSPGNLLDLYGAVDIPECETHFGPTDFSIPGLRKDSNDVVDPEHNSMIFKFASSAAHVYGKPLVSSETFVWLTDHFKTSLSQCKPEVERLFLSGVNHTFYHGTTYSPKEVPFPGWLFYAAVNFVPSNSFWPHLSGLNGYITRCQSVLQSGTPDNELLLYWPVYDNWNKAKGLEMQLSFHNTRSWLTPTTFYSLATRMQDAGYLQDFASDQMLSRIGSRNGTLQMGPSGNVYKALVVPACKMMPVATLQKILQLAENGATVVFEQLPEDVPGFKDADARKTQLKNILSRMAFGDAGNSVKKVKLGKGQVYLADDVQQALEMAGIQREKLTETGLQFIRRNLPDGKYYYLVNHTAKVINTSIPLNTVASSVVIMDPLTGVYGKAEASDANGTTKVRVQLQPGEALFLRSFTKAAPQVSAWKYLDQPGNPLIINGTWKLHFTQGGPKLPSDQEMKSLVSWTSLTDTSITAFSGSGEYTITFNLPAKNAKEYLLDLGQVCESAHVWINGMDAGIFWSVPFQSRVGIYLKPGKNTLKIEVANLMANRVRDMDRKGIQWRKYHEINFVNNHYKPFDASNWEPMPSGLLGPVRIIPVN
ncbi:glycosyl hydrolase [Chitinophagaceae bacterium LB-8]|uniref:Glycosyl hydrolase n=1 Tax=Paraflavisolibacter caeni TaxID=2982496 RepID=A0A9X3BFU6_9BACT|nr:glycosyl hydrolase [Paraflavisolibacter caeni]MCU7549684.1 glycosyl hydrolase [Paraflavisolibacter caeni]